MGSMRVVLVLLLALAPLAFAAGEVAPAAAQTGSQAAVTGTERPQDINPVEARRLRFLFWAYNVIWILLALYLVSLWLRLGSVRRELARLQHRLQGLEKGRSCEGGP